METGGVKYHKEFSEEESKCCQQRRKHGIPATAEQPWFQILLLLIWQIMTLPSKAPCKSFQLLVTGTREPLQTELLNLSQKPSRVYFKAETHLALLHVGSLIFLPVLPNRQKILFYIIHWQPIKSSPLLFSYGLPIVPNISPWKYMLGGRKTQSLKPQRWPHAASFFTASYL